MKVVITGGAGFIGINTAAYFASKKWSVVLLDNLSRMGTRENLAWLRESYPLAVFIEGDIRDPATCENLCRQHADADMVVHLAAQVAVTTSVVDPRADFETNALGTFNLLEAVRQYCPSTFVIYASTNKVYGHMSALAVLELDDHYAYRDIPDGISEAANLEFYSPYGCSKGCADQYMLDYARIYGLSTSVFRQSCIYGTRQFGMEDQGWVAWFTIATTLGRQITIYGDGKQVRDILFIDDLVSAYEMAFLNRKATSGQVYNIGGGPDNVMSLLQLVHHLENLHERKLTYLTADWRPGDQKIYISDIRKAREEFGWHPQVCAIGGVKQLHCWVADNRETIEKLATWWRR